MDEYLANDATGCWIWQKTLRMGYGRAWRDGRLVSAHRWYWEQLHGPVPEGLELDHVCHNGTGCKGGKACLHRRCVNPDHLELVTRERNVRRGVVGKLTAGQVAEIKAQPWAPRKELAARYGVGPGNISAIRAGKTWREVRPAAGFLRPEPLRNAPQGAPTARRRAPLTEAEIAEIRAAPKVYGVNRALAHKFGVADSTISAARTGQNHRS